MFYEPMQAHRYFERDLLYSDINWMHFPDAVDAFELRIRGWYVKPMEILLKDSWHHMFTVMAMACMLVDMLSQYRYGVLSSEGKLFRNFVKDHLPNYAGTMPLSIWHFDLKHPKGKELKEVAEVLWHGFRCGILHQAHAPLYCALVPGNHPPTVEATNHAKYGLGAAHYLVSSDCPVLVVRPEHLFEEVRVFFAGYLRDLKDQATQYDSLRICFKTKFADSFGIDLSASTF